MIVPVRAPRPPTADQEARSTSTATRRGAAIVGMVLAAATVVGCGSEPDNPAVDNDTEALAPVELVAPAPA